MSNSFPVDAFDIIRKYPNSKNRKNVVTDRVHKHLLKCFILKTKKIVSLNPSVLFIPCGELARNFLEECNLPPENVYSEKVPHPSRNQWSQVSNFENFAAFIELIGDKVNNS
jgi:hypothetical protein